MIDRQLVQLTRLLDDLLDLGRITRDTLALRKEVVGLVALLQGAVESVRPEITQLGHELVLDLSDEPIVVRADSVRLTQVFANLLDNAAKYTEPGGRIEVALERRGSWIEVRVTDNGIGIPASELPHVFDIFTRLDTSRSRKTGGLGIGLSLVKRLVEMHGGTVAAFSEGPARGSVFTVRLPVALDSSVPSNDADFNALAGIDAAQAPRHPRGGRPHGHRGLVRQAARAARQRSAARAQRARRARGRRGVPARR